jgi:hypothetical protein
MMRWWIYLFGPFDRFLFQGCDPRIVPILRIGFAILILIQVGVLWPDAEYWFADTGVLTTETASRSVGDGRWSIFFWLPATALTVKLGLGLMAGHAMLMLLGIASRIQAAAIFLWLISFHNRNTFIHDGEDAVFRIFAFLMVWLPLDCAWSYWNCKRAHPSQDALSKESAWGLRLIQIEMTAIYASTALCKTQGDTWWNGSAVWIVSKMQDNYGRLIPGEFFDGPWSSSLATWGTLLVEFALPVALWVRPIRNYAVLAGISLHLGIEVSMNLFLFQWVMMLGLLAFIDLDRFPFRRRVRVQSNLA